MSQSPKGLGRQLGERREDAKGTHRKQSQREVGDKIGLSQTSISNIENGHKDPELAAWRPVDLYDLFQAYGLAPSEMLEWAQEYHLDAFQQYLTDRTRMYGVDKAGGHVRFAGVIGAGRIGESWAEDEIAFRTCPDHIASKYRLEDIFAVEVSGGSMISDSARDHIPPSSVVFFHTKLQPEPGEIVCVYLPKQDHTVIKRFETNGQYTVLRSHNDQHAPIVIGEDENAHLQGVYLSHEVLGPRLR